MAGTVTVDWGSLAHVTPNNFAMVDVEAYDNESYPDQNLRDMIYGIGAEGYRLIAHMANTGTVASPDSQWMNRVNVIKYLVDRQLAADGRQVAMGFGALSGPASIPSHADPRGSSDLQTSGQHSPAEALNWLNYLKNTRGIPVTWMEFINEPGTQAGAWWTSPVSGYSDLGQAGQDWAAVHMRQFFDPIISNSGLHAGTLLCAGAGVGPYDGTFLDHMIGAGRISSALLTDSNMNHFDAFSEHGGYGSFRNTSTLPNRQAILNDAVDPTWNDGNTLKAGWNGTNNRIRVQLDANGGTAKSIVDSEWQPDGAWGQPYATNWMAGIMQTVQYILAFNQSAKLKLKSKVLMAVAVDDHFAANQVGAGLIIGSQGGPYVYSPRAYNLIQQVHPFSVKYKQQVAVSVTNNPSTPAGTKNNPMPAIYCAAGLKSNGSDGALLLCNIDLTNAQDVTFVFSRASTGAMTLTRLLQTDGNGTPLTSFTVASSTAFHLTLQPGEVILLEAPGVGGTPSSAPVNTALPTISGTGSEGQTLTASNGSWSNAPTSFSYQWRRCNSSGVSCADLSGATGQTYVVQAGDVGSTIRVRVIATNSFGSSAAADSAAFGISVPDPSPPTGQVTVVDVGARTHYSSTGNTRSITLSSGVNLLIVRHVNRDNEDVVTGMTYNGVALTKLGSQVDSPGNTGYASIWFLKAPAVGSAHNLVITLSGGAHPCDFDYLGLSGVNQTTPFGSSVKTSARATSASLSVPSATGEVVIDLLYAFQDTTLNPAVTNGQTQDANGANTTGSGDPYMASSHVAGVATATPVGWSWTAAGIHYYAYIAVSVKASISPGVGAASPGVAGASRVVQRAKSGGGIVGSPIGKTPVKGVRAIKALGAIAPGVARAVGTTANLTKTVGAISPAVGGNTKNIVKTFGAIASTSRGGFDPHSVVPAPLFPIVPGVSPFTDIERDFVDNEPPGLFPMDQTSYWGQVRKVQTDVLQELADQMAQWYRNLDPNTVDANDILEWEFIEGLPVAPAGKSLEERRAAVISRRARGPLTRARRRAIVESFISSVVGPPLQFFPEGIPFTADGMQFFSDPGAVTTKYEIVEDIPNYTYTVYVLTSAGVDEAGLTRELARATPAGIDFDVSLVSSLP